MPKWGKNGEGYADSTTGIAIQRVSREERKAAMGKRKNSRLKGIGDATMGKIRGLLKERLGEHEDG